MIAEGGGDSSDGLVVYGDDDYCGYDVVMGGCGGCVWRWL